MVQKKIRKIFLIGLVIIPFSYNIQGASEWENHTVSVIIDSDQYLLENRKILHPSGIIVPSQFSNEPKNDCFLKNLKRSLSNFMIGKSVKIKPENLQKKDSKSLPEHLFAHIKIEKTENLAEFLLSQGWAITDPTSKNEKYFKDYKKIEETAKKNRLGHWGGCNTWNKIDKMRFESGLDGSLKPEYRSFLAPISAGFVTEVLDGNTIKLQNGLKIKLLHLSVPEQDDPRPAYQCIAKESQKFLENLVFGKKVLLEKDQSQISKINTLFRYVFLPENRWQKKQFINQILLENGYAKFDQEQKIDQKYYSEFSKIENKKNLYTKENLKECTKLLFLNEQKNKKEEKPIIYDEQCPIKGNISGSKKSQRKTYHTPLSAWYKKLKYEQCFLTEEAAQNAGFEKVK